jgi:hypothetical protein
MPGTLSLFPSIAPPPFLRLLQPWRPVMGGQLFSFCLTKAYLSQPRFGFPPHQAALDVSRHFRRSLPNEPGSRKWKKVLLDYFIDNSIVIKARKSLLIFSRTTPGHDNSGFAPLD